MGQFYEILGFFAQELVNFYTTISQNEENTLIRAFMLSQGDRTRASQLVEQMDLKLHRYYQEVFPAYYAKLDGLSPQTRRFYKEIVNFIFKFVGIFAL
jgi:hypothetical protein